MAQYCSEYALTKSSFQYFHITNMPCIVVRISTYSASFFVMSAGTPYTFKGSGNSCKVRLLEALLSIQLKHEELDFLGDQQYSSEFLKINPRGKSLI